MDINNMKYEDAIKKLEETVAVLEKNDLPLDETVKLYDEAVKLSGYCQAMLDSAKLRISQLEQNGED